MFFEEQRNVLRRFRLVNLELEDHIARFIRVEDENIENQKLLNENENKKISRIVSDIKNQS